MFFSFDECKKLKNILSRFFFCYGLMVAIKTKTLKWGFFSRIHKLIDFSLFVDPNSPKSTPMS